MARVWFGGLRGAGFGNSEILAARTHFQLGRSGITGCSEFPIYEQTCQASSQVIMHTPVV